MAKVPKRMCKLKKDYVEKHLEDFSDAVLPAAYACKGCGRVASKKKYLCKPIALKKK